MTTVTERPVDSPARLDVGRLSSRGRIRRAAPNLTLGAFVAVLAYLVLYPMARLQIIAFRDGAHGYQVAYLHSQIWSTIETTVLLAVGSTLIALIFGTWLAVAATKLSGPWKVLRAVPVIPIVVPAIAAVTGWAFMLSPRPGYLNVLLRQLPWWSHRTSGPINVYSLPWIVIITGVSLTSFVFMFVSTGLQGMNAELLEAARVSGAGPVRVFVRVTLPVLRPALIYGAGVALLLGLGQFTAPLLLGTSNGLTVLTTDMYNAVSDSPSDYGAAAAFGSPLLLVGIAVVVFQRVMLGDQSRFVTHGQKGFRQADKTSPFAPLAIILYALVAVVLPLIGLLVVSLSPFWTSRIRPNLFSLNNYRDLFSTPATAQAIQNSIVISLIAVAVTIPLGYACARVVLSRQANRVLRNATDLIVSLPLGVPAVVFGVGFLLTYTGEPLKLYGTRWVVVLVYVTIMLPFAARMMLSGMVSLGEQYTEAARVSGASGLVTLLRVNIPLLRSAIGGATALIFVMLANEFAASLLVRSPTTQVMGTVLYDRYASGAYPSVAALAIVMTLVTAAGMGLALAIGGGKALRQL